MYITLSAITFLVRNNKPFEILEFRYTFPDACENKGVAALLIWNNNWDIMSAAPITLFSAAGIKYSN